LLLFAAVVPVVVIWSWYWSWYCKFFFSFEILPNTIQQATLKTEIEPRDRETERQRDRETERQRDKDREPEVASASKIEMRALTATLPKRRVQRSKFPLLRSGYILLAYLVFPWFQKRKRKREREEKKEKYLASFSEPLEMTIFKPIKSRDKSPSVNPENVPAECRPKPQQKKHQQKNTNKDHTKITQSDHKQKTEKIQRKEEKRGEKRT